jgi:FkbM family methyltransferase
MITELTQKMSAIDSKIIYTDQKELPFNTITIFGAGGRGKKAVHFFRNRGVNVPAVFDNDKSKHGSSILGVKVISPDQIHKFNQWPVIIASHWETAIYQQLQSVGVTGIYHGFRHHSLSYEPELIKNYGQKLNKLMAQMADEASKKIFASALLSRMHGDDGYLRISPYCQYCHPVVKAFPNETVLDAGGLSGDTAKVFFEQMQHRGKIYCFEPCIDHYELLCKSLKDYDYNEIVVPVCKGIWKERATVSFKQFFDEPGCSRIVSDGEQRIEVISIDEFVQEEGLDRVDLIKSDIEGAEMELLQGAEKTIRKYIPKLQISIYHYIEHLWEIQEYILNLEKRYNIYIGHHKTIQTETVLYAMPPS